MKFPIRRIPGTAPPKFEYYTVINNPSGGTQAIRNETNVVPSLEKPLCDLLNIAAQLAKENEELKRKLSAHEESANLLQLAGKTVSR